MPKFVRQGPGPGGQEAYFKDILIGTEKLIKEQRQYIADDLLKIVRDNIARGVNTGSYSTRAGWFSLTPDGDRRREHALASAADQKRRLAFPGTGVVNAGYFPGGYAQYRAVYRGETPRTRPVTFEFTGEMMRKLRGIVSNSGPGVFSAYLGFERQQRSRGSKTNRQLAEILSKRGRGRSPFQPTARQADAIVKRALKRTGLTIR
jgi:hypothetical protein